MLALIDHMRAEGFVHTAHLVSPLVVDKPDAIVPAILVAASAIETPEGVASVIERMLTHSISVCDMQSTFRYRRANITLPRFEPTFARPPKAAP